jgi:conjugal transfer pilus assembly protein TraA|tara:strand:+ start:1975 stop:2208 length:234 start_codon:yes stop_codon:yes gene_type:complete
VAAAHAGTDTTFDSIATQITDWTDGSLGRVATVAAGAVMIFNIVTGFKWQVVASAVATGLAVNFGPSVISGMTTATF